MSGYRKNIVVKLKIEGMEHVVTMRPMTFEESLMILDAGSKESADGQRARQLAVRRQIPGAVVSIAPPVTDVDGLEIPASEIFSSAYFVGDISEAINAWVSAARPANPPLPAA